MSKILFGAIAGLIAGLILPARPREQLSRRLSGIVGGIMAQTPDG